MKSFLVLCLVPLSAIYTQGQVPGVHIQQERGCKDPPNVKNGKWEEVNGEGVGGVVDWYPGSQAQYTCDVNYLLVGPSVITCKEDGEWSQHVNCTRPKCRYPIINDGWMESSEIPKPTSYYPQDTLTFRCNPRYRLIFHNLLFNEMILFCTASGSWQTKYGEAGDLPVCQSQASIVCSEPPLVSNAIVRIERPGKPTKNIDRYYVPQGSKAFYVCNENYELTDKTANFVQCYGGQWNGETPVCKPRTDLVLTCSEPEQLTNGYYKRYPGKAQSSFSPYTEGTKVFYMCQDGYQLSGDNLRECESGRWTGSLPVCSRGCPLPQQIAHGKYEVREYVSKVTPSSSMVDEGGQVDYTCHNGYTTGNQNLPVTLTCRNGQWQGTLPICVKRSRCDTPLQIPSGNWVIFNMDHAEYSKFGIGTRILYECEEGYLAYPTGPNILQCSSSGYWSDNPPKCLPKDMYCQDPGDINSGDYLCQPSHCNMFKVGTKLNYVCNKNFQPVGDVEQTCLAGGKWSGSKPTCIPVPTTPSAEGIMDITSNTMTVVIATSCSVLGLLMLVMVIVALQRRKPPARLCHPVQPATPPYTARPRTDSLDEHDRVALIAFADGVQVVLPSYEEATRGHSVGARLVDGGPRRPGEYRPLPTIPSALRGRLESPRGGAPIPPDSHRNSIITTASTTTRDNLSLAFGSMDTVNVSDGTSTTVTIETYDSGASNPSIALSQRAIAGSIASGSNGSLAADDAPLLEQRGITNEGSQVISLNQSEQSPTEEMKQES